MQTSKGMGCFFAPEHYIPRSSDADASNFHPRLALSRLAVTLSIVAELLRNS